MKKVAAAGRTRRASHPPLEGPRAYTVKDTCARLGISSSHFYVLLGAGKIRSIRIGGRRLVSHEEIERLLHEGAA